MKRRKKLKELSKMIFYSNFGGRHVGVQDRFENGKQVDDSFKDERIAQRSVKTSRCRK